MKVLAIDPGYGRCGVAVIEQMGHAETLLYSECIETAAQDEFTDRLAAIIATCERIIDAHNPDAFAIEKLYFNTNQKTAMRVAEVRGALLNMAAMHNMAIHEYTPPQIKSAVTGSGRADKRQVATMLHALLKIEKKPKYDDEYDAIAVGITHLAYTRHLR